MFLKNLFMDLLFENTYIERGFKFLEKDGQGSV